MAAVMSLSTASVVKAPLGLSSKRTNAVCLPKRSMRAGRTTQVTKAFSDVNMTICAANATMLFLGRFAFLPYQRAQVEKAGMPVQNGISHAEAGDALAEEAAFIGKSKDPAGFSLIDVMAWGSLGHALGFALLATQSNGYSPW
ncbi:hypothetical protein CYMTET_28090 [Cymbomonas tetramitiformis]|uniref:PSI-G n=1 Tax=Cymbomonas tetramitiformis TaxID=36881 RepID=A0AAE0KW95_9CHLO|nr:hypothetical protein CYMTET_28090 [Cymbomonas tetramitiformis]|eukprot:gene12419-14674_t